MKICSFFAKELLTKHFVIPANAGIQAVDFLWMPVFASMMIDNIQEIKTISPRYRYD